MHDQVLSYIIVRDISPYQFLINLSENKLHFKVTISQHYNISNSLRKNISGRDNDNHRGCEFHSFQKINTYMFYNNIEIWQHIHPLLNMMIDLKCTTIQYGVQGPGGLSIMAYTGRLRLKEPRERATFFSLKDNERGYEIIHRLKFMEGDGNLSCLSVNGLKRTNRRILGCEMVAKTSWYSDFFILKLKSSVLTR